MVIYDCYTQTEAIDDMPFGENGFDSECAEQYREGEFVRPGIS